MGDIVVGAMCVVERRFGFQGNAEKPQHRWQSAITRVTPTRAYMGRDWFALADETREVKPKYSDYRTNVVEVKS